MNLGDIISLAVSTIGINDNVARTQAQTFAQLRWKMIWDSENWNQAKYEVLGTVPANTEEVTLPPQVETVIAARLGGNQELLPSHSVTEMAADPQGFGTSGLTLSFSVAPRDSSGNVRIRLHRPLAAASELLFICKRKCVELTSLTDVPSIAGADQALFEYTLGDLYRWQRQLSKADMSYQKAMALLDKMKEIERQQTARRARIIPFTEPYGYSGYAGFQK